MKYLIIFFTLLVSSFTSASVHFNVSVGKDFHEPISEHFDSVYFQSTGDAVVVDKVVVRTEVGECELFTTIKTPTLFKWGKRWAAPIWDCKHGEVTSVSIYTPKYIYTYRL